MDEVEIPTTAVDAGVPVLRTHSGFNASDADITIKSSDGVLFRVHSKNLETHTGAFPGAEFIANPDEITPLTETSAVLEVLFQFIYPRHQPDLDDLSFEIALPLAEAVEKYEVFAAMKPCGAQLRRFLPAHSAEILAHAIRHDDPKLINAAVPNLARLPLTEVLLELPSQFVLPWCHYHEAWRSVFKRAITKVGEQQNSCRKNCNTTGCAEGSISKILQWENILSLSSLEETLQMSQTSAAVSCYNCGYQEKTEPRQNSNITEAARLVREGIKALPPFSDFLRGNFAVA